MKKFNKFINNVIEYVTGDDMCVQYKFRLIKIGEIINFVYINYLKVSEKEECVNAYLVIAGGATVVEFVVDMPVFHAAGDSGAANQMK